PTFNAGRPAAEPTAPEANRAWEFAMKGRMVRLLLGRLLSGRNRPPSRESQATGIRCWSCGARRGLADLLDASREIVCQPVCDCYTVSCADCGAELWLDFHDRSV